MVYFRLRRQGALTMEIIPIINNDRKVTEPAPTISAKSVGYATGQRLSASVPWKII